MISEAKVKDLRDDACVCESNWELYKSDPDSNNNNDDQVTGQK